MDDRNLLLGLTMVIALGFVAIFVWLWPPTDPTESIRFIIAFVINAVAALVVAVLWVVWLR